MSQTPIDGDTSCWQHAPAPATITISGANPLTAYGEYRTMRRGVVLATSPAGEGSIIYTDVSPSVSLNSPNGLTLAPAYVSGQTQMLNGTVPQWVSFAVSSKVTGEPVNVSVEGVFPDGSYNPIDLVVSASPYDWTGSSPIPSSANYTALQLIATDPSGTQAVTRVPSPATVFQLFDPTATSGPPAITCSSSTCTTLGEEEPNEIPGDPPSDDLGTSDAPVNACGSSVTFSGYSDPSMRADTVVTTTGTNGLPANPYGSNLYMLYSYPTCQTVDGSTYYKTVETHMAVSTTASGPNGGANWVAWCEAGCPSPCTTPYCAEGPSVTPVWQTVEVDPFGTSYGFNSHEVPNFWPYVDGSGNEVWYAVHLMYTVTPAVHNIPQSIQDYGCLVVSATVTCDAESVCTASGTPDGLAWNAAAEPAGCGSATDPTTFPANSAPLYYTQLDTWSGMSPAPGVGNCNSWGEPAIMVRPDAGGTLTAYLAASCYDSNFMSLGYWIFVAQNLYSGGQYNPPSSWTWKSTAYAGPLTYSNLPIGSYPPPSEATKCTAVPTVQQATANSLSEFDWAQRPGGEALVAVVTPTCVLAGTPTVQFPCAAVAFDLGGGSASFGSQLIATVGDGSPSDAAGCAFDPLSNTGVVVVRHLSSGANSDNYSIIDSAVLP